MGEEKRKREREVSEADKALKSPRLAVAGKSLKSPGLDLLAAVAFPSVSTRGRCHHMSVDMAVYDINNSEELPTCHYPGCGITWKGAGEDKAGMMRCIECHIISCARGVDRPDPRGHALWHARNCKHYGAQWYDEPNLGYCFKCGLVMRLRDNQWSEDECAEVDNEVTDAVDQWGMVAGNSADGHASGNGYVIRGMPNHGNTCYMNASLQCLLALGKMRTMILSPDVRLGDIGLDLKQLFVETSSANNATHMLDPRMILVYMESLYQDQERFKIPKMEDSHEFLTSLRDALDNEVVQLNNSHVMQGGEVFPTFGQSIFRGQLNQTVSCKRCSNNSVTDHSFDGLQLAVPSKDPSARSNPLQVDSCEVKDIVHGHLQTQKNDVAREIVEVTVKYLDFIPSLFDDCEEMEESSADSYNPEDKGKARGSNSLGSIEDCLTLHFHGLTICKNCPKVAELLETNESKNVEPIMASTNANTTVDEDQTELSNRKTFPNERSTDFNSFLVVSSSRQPYPSDSHHEVTLSDDITTEEITSGKSCGEKDLASCSTAKEKAESRREGVQKAGPSCLPTDKQTDLLSVPDIQDTSTQKQGKGKHVLDDHSAQQVEETHNEQTDGNGSAVQTQLISKLPPVLTIQLKRYAPDLSKLRGHVSFKEILRLGPFMDPRLLECANERLSHTVVIFCHEQLIFPFQRVSSEDKDNSRYRLVGVIEHFGNTLNSGHYIAYVRGSGSSWVRASDRDIEVVSLEKVLRCEAYILFYERMED